MATISIGGLATGLDTNAIIDKLVSLERRRSVGLLESQQDRAEKRESALQIFDSKLVSLLAAVDKLRDPAQALTRKATTSDSTVLTATAGSGAVRGTTQVTVTTLARGSIASAASGTTSATATVATGSGSFAFRLGSGATQTVSIDATTTLQGLADSVNALGVDVTATVVNIGTSAAPDYRLRLGSVGTGTSNDLTIVTDNTTLGVAVTQAAQNASLTVSGFATAVARESNVIGDVIPGVTLTLSKTGGPVTVGVEADVDAVGKDVQAVVDAYNDLVAFVRAQSEVAQDTSSADRTVSAGPLAFDSSVRSVLDSLRSKVTSAVSGLTGDYTLLAQVGVTSTKDGTLQLDSSNLQAALAQDENDVAALFGGTASLSGVFDGLHDYISGVTQSGGVVSAATTGVADELRSLESRIDAAQRQLDRFESGLRATFASLERLVSQLQSQGSFLQSLLVKS